MNDYGLDGLGPWILHETARLTGDAISVQMLLDAGADPNSADHAGLAPLHYGVQNGDTMVTTYLLGANADPNARDSLGRTSLHHAAMHDGNPRILFLLVAGGADPRAKANDGHQPLHFALRRDPHHQTVTALIELGGANDLTPLQLASLRGDSLTVVSLLARRDRQPPNPNETDALGWGPMHFAVASGSPGTVAVLLANGAAANSPAIGGITPLDLAILRASEPVLQLLACATGADNPPEGLAIAAELPHQDDCAIPPPEEPPWSLYLENDMLRPPWKTDSDQWYTNGFRFAYTPKRMTVRDEDRERRVQWMVGQHMFTPSNLIRV
ncbi:MAG: DUF2219 family protein, partial [Gemmatimonadetes bacterium]|nr:DUF2219 family protein [Gemmatimonadota bacterium]